MLGLPAPEIDQIEHGGLMHDIGKIGIGGSQLNKPQRLTADEYLMFQSHPVKGKRILEPVSFCDISFLVFTIITNPGMVLDIPRGLTAKRFPWKHVSWR